MYLSGKIGKHALHPDLMMEDITGDYRENTVTVENFPHEEGVKAVSIHPCQHASVMKSLMARANNALKLRREKQRMAQGADNRQELGGLSGDMNKLDLAGGRRNESERNAEDEWEVVETNDNPDEDEVAIRVDQYLVVFLKVRKHPRRESMHVLTMCLSLWLQSSQMLKLTIQRPSERGLQRHKTTEPSWLGFCTTTAALAVQNTDELEVWLGHKRYIVNSTTLRFMMTCVQAVFMSK